MYGINYGDPGTHITDGLSHQQHLTLAGMVQAGWNSFSFSNQSPNTAKFSRQAGTIPKSEKMPKNPNFEINR